MSAVKKNAKIKPYPTSADSAGTFGNATNIPANRNKHINTVPTKRRTKQKK